jgi:Family of unknown function (DUF6010)
MSRSGWSVVDDHPSQLVFFFTARVKRHHFKQRSSSRSRLLRVGQSVSVNILGQSSVIGLGAHQRGSRGSMSGLLNVIGPVLVANLYIAACSFFREPNRMNFNAIMIAGASAAYLSGGFGKWEFAFTAIVTYFAYRGLRSYNFIGIGWLFHTGWDVLHHLYGKPIVPFAPTSSLGCAICDPVIAIWCFAGAPSVYDLFRRRMIFRSQ